MRVPYFIKNSFFILVFLGLSLNSSAQINKIVDTGKESFILDNLQFYNGRYLVPADYGSPQGNRGLLVEVDQYINNIYIHDNIDPGLIKVYTVGTNVFLVGAPVESSTEMRLISLEENLENQKFVLDYEITGTNTINSGITNIEDSIYIVNVNNQTSEQDPRQLQVWKIGLDGQELKTRTLFEEEKVNYAFEINNTSDGNLLISSAARYDNKFGTYETLTKLTSDLEVIWIMEGDERSFPTAYKAHAELSDGRIVTKYRMDYGDTLEYVLNDIYPFPTRINWYSSEGELLKQDITRVYRPEELYYKDVEAGYGDYFFMYGRYQDLEEFSHGIITKYSNDGDTLWSRKLRHPDYTTGDETYSVRDIIEHQDGTIGVLCQILKPGGGDEAWLFELNEYGCFNGEDCNEEIVVSTSGHLPSFGDPITLYPNPTCSTLIIHGPSQKAKINIYNNMGALMISKHIHTNHPIDVSSLQPGFYHLSVISNDDVESIPFVVE